MGTASSALLVCLLMACMNSDRKNCRSDSKRKSAGIFISLEVVATGRGVSFYTMKILLKTVEALNVV